jgi:uncharacterized protein with PIN domain
MIEQSPRLLADAMLGRLCKWLRLLGYDTVYALSWTEHQIAARARAQNRIVLTRDRELCKRKGMRCLFIRSQVLEEQIKNVLDALGMPPVGQVRCPQCNTLLVAVSPRQAQGRVPGHVLDTQRDFAHCSTCDKMYWPGSHWDNIQSTLKRIRDAH